MRTFYPSSTLTFLNTGAPYLECDLLTIVLQSGTIVRLCNYDVDVTKPTGEVFLHTGPLFRRSGTKQKRGLEVSQLTLNLYPAPTDLLSGVAWMKAARAGVLDYARIIVDTAFFDVTTPTVLMGWCNWFTGSVALMPSIEMQGFELQCKNDAARFDVLMPRNLVQPGCLHTLYDAGCTVSKAAFTKTATVTGVNGDGSLACTVTGGVPASSYYDKGALIVTSGDNANVVRDIKTNSAGNFYLFAPLPFPILAGATITVRPGCDKQQPTCSSKYANLPNFLGMPYVPAPESVL